MDPFRVNADFRTLNDRVLRSVVRLWLAGAAAASAGACRSPRAPTPGDAAAACAAPELFDPGAADSVGFALGVTSREREWTRTAFSFDSPDGGRVPAMLWQPTAAGPHPLLLLAPGYNNMRTTLAPLAEAYAAAGAIVVSITPPVARQDSKFREFSLFRIPLFDTADRAELVQYVRDLRRTLDVVLEHFAEGAPSIAFAGHSYGATAGAILAGTEPRIDAFALAAGANSLRDRFPEQWVAGDSLGLAGVRPMGSERWERMLRDVEARCFIRYARPDALLLQFGRADPNVPPAAARNLADAAPPGTAVLWYDTGHALSPEAWRDQADWLAARIAIRTARFGSPDIGSGS